MNAFRTCILICCVIIGAYLITYRRCATRTLQIQDAAVLRVGTNATFAPFTFVNEKGDIVGFDIDLVQEIARRLDKKIEIRDTSFTSLIPELQTGSIHLAAAGFTPTPERAARINFSTVYLKQDPFVIITRPNSSAFARLEDLKGYRVIVNMGYTTDSAVSAIPEINVIRLDTTADAFMALKSGQADAFVTAQRAAQPFFDQYPDTSLKMTMIPDTQETYALAVSKQYPELLPIINDVLKELERDGTLENLKKRWNLA